MTVNRQRVRQVFMEVADLLPAERAAVLARTCLGDDALRAEVEALFRAEQQAAGFMGSPTGATPEGAGYAVAAAPREREGQMIGRYKLLQPIGEGGFGSVWLAEQREPVKRRVALKIIKLGMDTKQVIARFEAERQALAMMDHPNIARVLDAGATETGRPYFVMEYIKGVPILEYCDTDKLATTARLELFSSVCHAIQHAHQKGIIHRDIKPSNVLITMHDGVPVPKVIDFGIAKATGSELTAKTLFTEHRQMIGTPAYMSPEQAEMSGLDIDTRSDIYSLGVLLYELLTGTTPFSESELRRAGFAEMMRIIREVEPLKPSTRLSSLGDTGTRTAEQRRVGDTKKLRLILRGDLDWIVMKCLEKDRTRRYETANGLATDIKRHLNDETVTAGAPSAGYRLRKFVKRNRAQVIAGSVVAGALVLGVVGTTSGMIWALNEKDLATAERAKAIRAAESEAKAKAAAQENEKKAIAQAKRAAAISEFVTTALSAGDATSSGFEGRMVGARWDMTILAAMDYAIKDIDSGRFKDDPETEAGLRRTIGRILQSNGRLREAEPLLRKALEVHRLLGDEHPDTLVSMGCLGLLLQAQGKPAEAEPYIREALERRQRVLGDEHPDTLISIGAMGLLLHRQGKLAEAEPYTREALEKKRRVLGDEHPFTLTSTNNLGALLWAQGRLNEAEPYTREALEKRRRVLGDEHPDTLMSMGNMAALLRAQGRLAEAEPYTCEALDKHRRVLGEDHPDTLISIHRMGELLRAQGRLAEAEPYYREALERRARVLGQEHPDTVNARANLGALYWSQGKLDKAIPLLEEVFTAQEATLGRQHADTLMTMGNLGVNYKDAGRLAEAIPLLEEVYRASKRDPKLEFSGLALLDAYTKAADQSKLDSTAKALALVQELLGATHGTPPKDSPARAQHLAQFGLQLLTLKAWDAAEPLLRECLAIRETAQPDDWRTFNTKSLLGGALLGQNKLAEAEPLLLDGYRGLKERETALPAAGRVRIPEAIERLVRLYEAKGDETGAAAWRGKLEAARAEQRKPESKGGGG